MHEWTVYLSTMDTARVSADSWQVGPNGDLAFINEEERGRDPFFVRAFAAGTWREVSLYD
jgi:hypothetical protein